ncbi:MAG TPA: response regulator transcription factor [Bryobacteraceae bacterium]|nr:response regulator transcription factor [Bryobacteraceae bacterium]
MEELRPPKQLRLLIVGDRVLFRTSLARLLASECGFESANECETAGEALEFLKTSPVDVVLLDLTARLEPAYDFISAARTVANDTKFLLMAETADNQSLAASLKAGASGIFRKSEAPARLVLAIQVVAASAVWLDQSTVQLLSDRNGDSIDRPANRKSANRLGDREATVIQGIMEGLTTRRISDNMGLPESKVKNILQGLFAKTGVRKRSQLVRLALEGSLVANAIGETIVPANRVAIR